MLRSPIPLVFPALLGLASAARPQSAPSSPRELTLDDLFQRGADADARRLVRRDSRPAVAVLDRCLALDPAAGAKPGETDRFASWIARLLASEADGARVEPLLSRWRAWTAADRERRRRSVADLDAAESAPPSAAPETLRDRLAAASAAARDLGDERLLGRATLALARVEASRGDAPTAIVAAADAASVALGLGDSGARFDAALVASEANLRLERPADARRHAEEARDIADATLDGELAWAARAALAAAVGTRIPRAKADAEAVASIAHHERASAAFRNAGLDREAAEELEAALQIARHGGLEEDYRRLHTALLPLAVALAWDVELRDLLFEPPSEETGDAPSRGVSATVRLTAFASAATDSPEGAAAAARDWRIGAESARDRNDARRARAAEGSALTDLGRYGDAWVVFDDPSARPDPTGHGPADADLERARARLLCVAGLYAEALPRLIAAEGLHLASNDRSGAALDATLRSRVRRSMGRFDEAVVDAMRANEHASGSEDLRVRDAAAWERARACLDAGRAGEAEAALDTLAAEARRGRRRATRARALLLRAEVHAARGAFGPAERDATEAAEEFRRAALPYRQILAVAGALPYQVRVGKFADAAEGLAGLADSLLRIRLPNCPEEFRIEMAERLRVVIPLVPSIFAAGRPVGAAAARPSDAFLALEHLRALRDGIAMRRYPNAETDRAPLPQIALRDAEAGVKRVAAELETIRATAPADRGDAIVAAEQRVRLAEAEVRLVRRRDLRSRRYLEEFRRLGPRDLRAFQEDPRSAEAAYLSFVLGADRSILGVVTAATVSLFELPPEKEIARQVGIARDLLASARTADDRGAYADAALSLARILFAPARDALERKRVYIVSVDGCLSGLPFEALPDPFAASSAGSDPSWLGESRVIGYAPGFASLSPPPEDPPVERIAQELLLVAGPSAAPLRPVPAAESALASGLQPSDAPAPIPGAGGVRELGLRTAAPFVERLERAALHRLSASGGEALLARVVAKVGDRATEDEVWGDRTRYRFVVLALPFGLNEAAPWLSGFACAPDGGIRRGTEGFLYLSETRYTLLACDLLALPTTRSGSGRADVVRNAARSFLSAGARRVLVRVREDPDEGPFLEEIYAEIARAPDAAAGALAAVRSARVRSGAPPGSWSSFVLYGDPR